MKSIDDILQHRAERLDLERGDQLAAIQEVLNRRYMGRLRAKELRGEELIITTPSSAVANDVRLRQVAVIKQLSEFGVKKLRIQIS